LAVDTSHEEEDVIQVTFLLISLATLTSIEARNSPKERPNEKPRASQLLVAGAKSIWER
jgi:hypothetical protein